MSRSGLIDDCDEQWMEALWRGRVANARRGRRGQRFFRELLAALDAMSVKELHAETFDEGPVSGGDEIVDGGVCALGALARAKGIDITDADPEDDQAAEELAIKFDIADCLAREVIWANDEWNIGYRKVRNYTGEHMGFRADTPAERWRRMREWVEDQIKKPEPSV